MGFWTGERCEYCGGSLAERRVDLTRKAKGRYVVVEDVPAGVCRKCGTRYYAANVLKSVEAAVAGRRKARRDVVVHVYSFAPGETPTRG